MIRDFGSFTRRGLLADLECPAEIWVRVGHITDRAVGGKDWGGDSRRQKTTNLPAVRERDTQSLSVVAGDTN